MNGMPKTRAGMPARICAHVPTHPHAIDAIRAARNVRKWGRWATARYIARRQIPRGLFTLACVLETAARAGLP